MVVAVAAEEAAEEAAEVVMAAIAAVMAAVVVMAAAVVAMVAIAVAMVAVPAVTAVPAVVQTEEGLAAVVQIRSRKAARAVIKVTTTERRTVYKIDAHSHGQNNKRKENKYHLTKDKERNYYSLFIIIFIIV